MTPCNCCAPTSRSGSRRSPARSSPGRCAPRPRGPGSRLGSSAPSDRPRRAAVSLPHVLFPLRDLKGIADGTIDLAFRRWDKPRVKAGGSQRTRIGLIAFTDVKKVGRVSNKDAKRAGYEDAQAMQDAWAHKEGDLYRIELRLAGPDPRTVLREQIPTPEELDAIHARLTRMGEWTYEYLQAIADHPEVRAPDLAASFNRETHPFKLDVRKLKELGLTESLRIGYRLSPRGEAVMRSRTGRDRTRA